MSPGIASSSKKYWLAIVPVVESDPLLFQTKWLTPLAADGSFVLRTGTLGARTVLLCVVSEGPSGILLLTLCEEISTQERSVTLPWQPGRLRIVDDGGMYPRHHLQRVDERLTWMESDLPREVDLTLAPGRYRVGFEPTAVYVDVSPGRLSHALFENR